MTRFNQTLRDAQARLTVPEPARSRIMLELRADMEDLYQEYVGRGMQEDEAETAVAETFDLTDDVLRDLVQVHDTPLERSLESLSLHVQSPWSRLLMTGLALSVIVGSGTFLIRPEVYRVASPVVWAMLPLLVAGVWIAGGHAFRLFKAGRSWSPGLRTGLSRLLGLAVTVLVIAAGGLWIELYLSALRIREMPRETMIHFIGWLYTSSSTLVVFLSGALILAFLWFFLEARTRKLERLASSELLGGVS